MPEISLILPVYNVEKYIEKCLDSIYGQTFRDFEIILVDDGTKDESISVIRTWQSHKEIELKVISQENAGQSAARCRGVSDARGEYIMFIDPDDWIDRQMLAKLHEEAVSSGSDVVACNYVLEDEVGNALTRYAIPQKKQYDVSGAIKAVNDRHGVYPSLCNKLYKRKTIGTEDFPKGHFIGEDYQTLMNILQKTDKVVHLPYELYHYVSHEGSTVKTEFGEVHRESLRMYSKVRETLLVRYPELKRSIINYHLLEEMAIVNAMIRSDRYDPNLLEQIRTDLKKNLIPYVFNIHTGIVFKGAAVIMAVNMELYKWIFKKIWK